MLTTSLQLIANSIELKLLNIIINWGCTIFPILSILKLVFWSYWLFCLDSVLMGFLLQMFLCRGSYWWLFSRSHPQACCCLRVVPGPKLSSQFSCCWQATSDLRRDRYTCIDRYRDRINPNKYTVYPLDSSQRVINREGVIIDK